jgi:hypothetical protein
VLDEFYILEFFVHQDEVVPAVRAQSLELLIGLEPRLAVGGVGSEGEVDQVD